MTTFENGVIKEMYSVERQTPLPLTNDVTVATHLNRLYDLCSQFQGVPANAILKVSVLYICISCHVISQCQESLWCGVFTIRGSGGSRGDGGGGGGEGHPPGPL